MFERAVFNPQYSKQVKSQSWRKIKLETVEDVKVLHEHPLEYYESKLKYSDGETDDGTWRCNGVDIFDGGCKSGQEDFQSHAGTMCWRCPQVIINSEGQEEDCDFDICDMCLRWAIYCTRKGRRNYARVA